MLLALRGVQVTYQNVILEEAGFSWRVLRVGQAKLRGSREHRVREAVARNAEFEALRERLERGQFERLSPEEKNRILNARLRLAQLMCITSTV